MVGLAGFEPAASVAQLKRASSSPIGTHKTLRNGHINDNETSQKPCLLSEVTYRAKPVTEDLNSLRSQALRARQLVSRRWRSRRNRHTTVTFVIKLPHCAVI